MKKKNKIKSIDKYIKLLTKNNSFITKLYYCKSK